MTIPSISGYIPIWRRGAVSGAVALLGAVIITSSPCLLPSPVGAEPATTPLKAGMAPESKRARAFDLDEIEIHGELLVPQAVYIIADAANEDHDQATALDYIHDLGPLGDRVGLVLILLGEQ